MMPRADNHNAMLAPGQWFEGRYLVLSPVGHQAVGAVYRARCRRTGALVALKVFRRSRVGCVRTFGARFFPEGARRVRITHPNALRVVDYGRTADDDFFIATEEPRGPSLSRLVSARGPLTPRLVGQVLSRICSVLGSAHQCGVIHAGLRPDLVTLSGKGLRGIKVGGFDDPTLRGGTELLPFAPDEARHAAPERLAGDRLTPRTDVYGVGLVAYLLLTGRSAFEHDSAVRVLLNQRQGGPLWPRARDTLLRLAPELGPIIVRCLEPHPDRRFDSVTDILRSLLRAGARLAA
jgi:serine/threonine-protein kinase